MVKKARADEARRLSVGNADAAYHDVHLDDPEEWDRADELVVEPKPSGMSVFSLRLPAEEIAALRRVAERQGRGNVSELVREAVHAYLNPVGTWAALSIAGQGEAVVWASTPSWVGGRAQSSEELVLEMRPPDTVSSAKASLAQ